MTPDKVVKLRQPIAAVIKTRRGKRRTFSLREKRSGRQVSSFVDGDSQAKSQQPPSLLASGISPAWLVAPERSAGPSWVYASVARARTKFRGLDGPGLPTFLERD